MPGQHVGQFHEQCLCSDQPDIRLVTTRLEEMERCAPPKKGGQDDVGIKDGAQCGPRFGGHAAQRALRPPRLESAPR